MILWVVVFASIVTATFGQYEANWDSLDSRPLPRWYDEAKVGIFLHWGVYSVPGFGSEWFWKSLKDQDSDYVEFMEKNYRPSFTYQEFAKDFTAEFFNPYVWAQIFAKSGAKYVVLTSKHHEGFALWPSKYSYSWNSVDIGPKRDLVGDLSRAIRGENLVFGLYHSMFEWFHPVFNSDKETNFTTQEFVNNKVIPELKELVENYEPAIIWSDGATLAPDTYWKSTEFLAWLYNDSPVKEYAVVNDRWGDGVSCKHGDFITCNDRYNPGTLQARKWENAMTIDKGSWGYRRNAKLSDYMTTSALLTELVTTVSCGGNILINVGPTSDGMIAPIFQERLADMGTWLSINGEAIYSSTPWTAQNDSLNSAVWYTSKNETIYAIVLSWPQGNSLEVGSVVNVVDNTITVTLLGNEDDGALEWVLNEKSVTISFPDKATVKSEWAYVLKIERQNTITTNST